MHNTLHHFEALTRLLVITASCCFVQALAQFTISPGDTNVTEGSPLTINCSFTNANRLFWRKDGSRIVAREVNFNIETVDAGTSRLTLLPSADHTVHTGAYQCVAVSGSREDSVDFNVTVQYLSDPILRFEPFECIEDDSNPYLGSTVIIKCIAEGEPFPQVTWFYNGMEVREGNFSNVIFQQNNRQLIISQLSSLNVGDYHCRSENIIGQKSSTNTILGYRTTVPERMIEVVNDINGIVFAPLGGIGRINCQVIPPFPPVNTSVETVVFREGTTTIQSGNGYNILFRPACSVFSLIIHNISSIHATQYMCTFRQSTATTHLRIGMIIPIRVSISSPVVAVGGDVNMNCSFERRPGGQDVPQMLMWRFKVNSSTVGSIGIIPDGQRVIITMDAAGTSANLMIRGVTLDDYGTYICRGFNPNNLAIPVTSELNLVVGDSATVDPDVSDGTTNSMDVIGGTTVSSDISGGTTVTSGVSDKSVTHTISIILTTLFLSGLVVH